MPRTTNKQYIYRYVVIQVAWRQYPSYFAQLSSGSQSHLHDYFRPACEWGDRELLAHRRRVSMARPALPQQAGRAYAQLMRVVDAAERQPAARARVGTGKLRSVQVRGVRRASPDTERLVRVLIQWALTHRDELDRSDSASRHHVS